MKQDSRILTKALMEDLSLGILAPLVEAVRSDRDLNMELRGQCADIYCKGYQIHLKSAGEHGYKISVHEKFWEEELPLASQEDVAEFVKTKLPLNRSAATPSSTWSWPSRSAPRAVDSLGC